MKIGYANFPEIKKEFKGYDSLLVVLKDYETPILEEIAATDKILSELSTQLAIEEDARAIRKLEENHETVTAILNEQV